MNPFVQAAFEKLATMKSSAVPKFGLAIDFETSGYSLPNYAASHQGISFGAAIYEIATFSIVETLYREIVFDDTKYEWTMGAQNVHGITREHLEIHGISQAEAAYDLGNLVVKYLGTDKIPLLGHRVYFDEAFTNQLMASIDVKFEYDPIRIDSAAIGLAFLGTGNSNQLFEACGMPPRLAHNSLEDITYTLKSIQAIKQAFMA